jgi:ribosomal protein S18 acetylase RimI-like enzyme
MNAALTLRDAIAADLDEVRALFREYEAWLQADLCFQGFEEELATLPGKYVPPKGRLLLAELDGRIAGVIALREFEPGVCEMKRLFVREFARGHRVGRALAERLVAEAKGEGYRAMRLDTMPDRMGPANALYDSLGFRDIPAYYANPIPDVRYMELDLGA